jgi:hypothetical protein
LARDEVVTDVLAVGAVLVTNDRAMLWLTNLETADWICDV